MWRKATLNDISAMMEIVAEAQARLKSSGVDQWQDGYPNRTVLCNDIEKGNCHVLEENGRLIAFMTAICSKEPTYAEIYDGEWLTDNPYCVIHRMAVAESEVRKGIARSAYRLAEELARKAGMKSMRVDTHRDNKVMRHIIESEGYVYCGWIYLASGATRLAYEKIL